MAHIARIVGGFGLIVAGSFMLFLPGPGILTIAAGLALLAKELPWAGRLTDRVKSRLRTGRDSPVAREREDA